jgi:hypothetical protein
MTPTQKAAMEQALEVMDAIIDAEEWLKTSKARKALRAALEEDAESSFAKAEPDGLPLVIAGAIFDFAGYMTTRTDVIKVGATANAAPVADLAKEWAKLRGLSLDDAAVLSWQEWLPTAPHPTKQPLTTQEIDAVMRNALGYGLSPSRDDLDFARAIERAHGITGETK